MESTVPLALLVAAKLFRTYRDRRSRCRILDGGCGFTAARTSFRVAAIVFRVARLISRRDHPAAVSFQFLMRHKGTALIWKFSLSPACAEARDAGATPAITIVQRVTAPLYMSNRKFIVAPTPTPAELGTMCNAINPRNWIYLHLHLRTYPPILRISTHRSAVYRVSLLANGSERFARDTDNKARACLTRRLHSLLTTTIVTIEKLRPRNIFTNFCIFAFVFREN